SLLVTLWPDDPDWSCECPSQDDACPHVAAAVIAMRRAGESGELAPRPKVPVGTVAYRLRRGDRGLVLERFIARDGALEPLKVSLGGRPVRASGRPVGPHVVVEDAPGGFRVRLDRDPAIEELFSNGAARCGDELRPIGESGLTERERHELMREGGRVFPNDRV